MTWTNALTNWKVRDSSPAVACPTPPHYLSVSMKLKFGNFADSGVQAMGDLTYTRAEAEADHTSGITYNSCSMEATENDKATCYSKKVA